MARQPVQRMDQDILLRPVAAPTDSFVRPPALEDLGQSNLTDLARGLSKFDSGLSSFMAERDKAAEQEDAILAQADFVKNNSKGFAAGVADGTIPAQMSPAYVRAYKLAEGQNAGSVIEQKFYDAYEKWPGKNSEDPNAFNGFLQGFLKENLGDQQDPMVLRGLLPRLQKLGQEAVNGHISDRSKATKERATNAYSAQSSQTMEEAQRQALASGKSIDYEGTFAKLEQQRAERLAVGGTEADIDKILIDSVTAHAIGLNGRPDPRWLDFFNRKVPGQNFKYGDSVYGRQQRSATFDKLEVIRRQKESTNHTVEVERRRVAKETNTRDAVTFLLTPGNEGKPIPEDILKRGEVEDGSFRKDALEWQKSIMTNRVAINSPAVAEATKAIINGGGMATFFSALHYGTFKSAEEARAAYKLAEDVEKSRVDYGEVLKDSAATSIMGVINKRTQESDNLGAPFAPEGLSDTGRQAQFDFKRMLLAWTVQNPDKAKDPISRAEAIERIGKIITDRLGRADDGTGPATYDRRGMEKLETPWQPSRPDAPVQTPGGPTQPVKPAEAGTAPAAPQAPPAAPSAAPGPVALPGLTGSVAPGHTKRADGVETNVGVVNGTLMYQVKPVGGDWSAPAPVPVPGPSPAPTLPGASPPPSPEGGTPSVAPEPTIGAALRAGAAGAGEVLGEAVRTSPFARALDWLRGVAGRPRETPQPNAAVEGFRQRMAPQLAAMKWEREAKPLYDVKAATATDGSPAADGTTQVNEEMDEVDAKFAQSLSATIQAAIDNPTYVPRGRFALNSIKDNPVASRLLDFIAGPESNGNYNAVFGKANNKEDLSKFTVGQIMARQEATVRAGGQSATGKYQFIRKTLGGLVREMGISHDEPFTPELQDQMALQLLKRRGLDRYQAGDITLEQFANSLALEWASLPLLSPMAVGGKMKSAGQSAYAGDGLNKSHVSPDAVRAALTGEDGPTSKRRRRG